MTGLIGHRRKGGGAFRDRRGTRRRRGDGHPGGGTRAGAQLGQGPGGFVLIERLAVPAVQVLQERNARALVGLGQDAEGLLVQTNAAEDLQDFFDVVAVHVFHAPAKGFKPLAVGGDVVAQRGRLALPQPVDIHEGNQVVQLLHPGERGRLPHRAFGGFAVSEQHVGVVIQLIQPRGQRHAHADAQPLSERSGGHVGKRQARGGMPFEVRGVFAQLQQGLDREQSGLGPRRVEQRGGVSFGEDKAVVVMEMRMLGIIAHVPEEQCGHEIRGGQAGRGMSTAGGGGGGDRVNAQLVGDSLQ